MGAKGAQATEYESGRTFTFLALQARHALLGHLGGMADG